MSQLRFIAGALAVGVLACGPKPAAPAPNNDGGNNGGADAGTDVSTPPDTPADASDEPWNPDDYFMVSELGEIPEYEQREGNADKGYDILVNEGYVSCGIPTRIYDEFFGALTDNSITVAGRSEINADLPFNQTRFERDGIEIVSTNCLSCHANILPSTGELYVGLGNEGDYTLDFARAATLGRGLVNEEDPREVEEYDRFLARVQAVAPYVKMTTRGVNPADNLAGVLTAYRDPDTWEWLDEPWFEIPDIKGVPLSVPPWWHVKKKNALYYTSVGRGDHARFMMAAALLCTDSLEEARKIDEWFVHVRAYLETIEPPDYTWSIDRDLTPRGQEVFEETCSRCHGTYGADGAYPNLVLSLEEVGTDPVLARSGVLAGKEPVAWLNRSFFGEVSIVAPAEGYVAPPLDGIWASAPYFHNGSVPTVAAVIDSTKRPRHWKRRFDVLEYDPQNLGFVYEELTYGKDGAADDDERKEIYDTTAWGYGNAGHTFGDMLSEADRTALLEYLKTL